MAVRKRPAAVLARAKTTHGCKRRRTRIASTEDYEFEDTPCLGKGSFGTVVRARHRATGRTVAIKFPRRRRYRASVRPASSPPVPGTLMSSAPTASSSTRPPAGSGSPWSTSPDRVSTLSCGRGRRSRRPSCAPTCGGCSPAPRRCTGSASSTATSSHPTSSSGKGGKILKICDIGLAMSLRTADKTTCTDAGTLPYMAPEVLLGKPDYDAGADTWSLGCVMAEMLTGKTLFKGDVRRDDPVRQLRTIFLVLGSPDDRTWPEFASLPLAGTVRFREQQRSTLGDLFPAEMLSEDGYQVLKGLLECNPGKRLTAAAALQLPWFMPEHQHRRRVHPAGIAQGGESTQNPT